MVWGGEELGQQGGPVKPWSSPVVLDTEGSGPRRSGGQSSERSDGGEIRSRAARVLWLQNVLGEGQELLALVADANMEKYNHTHTHTRSQCESSFIRAWKLDFSVTIHIFLLLCPHICQSLISQPSRFQQQVQRSDGNAKIKCWYLIFHAVYGSIAYRLLCLQCRFEVKSAAAVTDWKQLRFAGFFPPFTQQFGNPRRDFILLN